MIGVIALLEKLLGSKAGRIAAEALVIALLLGSTVLYLEHRGARQALAKVQVSSAKALSQAKDQIAADVATYAASQSQNQGKLDAALSANRDLRDQLAERVRDFAAYRKAHPDVARATGQPGAASGGECGALDCGELAVQMGAAGNELAGSLGQVSAGLQACERDRDALTGKP